MCIYCTCVFTGHWWFESWEHMCVSSRFWLWELSCVHEDIFMVTPVESLPVGVTQGSSCGVLWVPSMVLASQLVKDHFSGSQWPPQTDHRPMKSKLNLECSWIAMKSVGFFTSAKAFSYCRSHHKGRLVLYCRRITYPMGFRESWAFQTVTGSSDTTVRSHRLAVPT